MMNKLRYIIRRIMQYLIYIVIVLVFPKVSLSIFQIISVETNIDIRKSNILASASVLFYICAVIPSSLPVIKKLKEKWEDESQRIHLNKH